jgi:hypothetical protein
MNACDELLIAGLQQQLGRSDVTEAYRELYAKQMEEHDRMIRHMLEELHRREGLNR